MKRENFIVVLTLILGVCLFGAQISYSKVAKAEENAVAYFLSHQSSQGAFQMPPYIEKLPYISISSSQSFENSNIPRFSVRTDILLDETAFTLKSLYSLGLSTNTRAFVNAANFITQLSTYTKHTNENGLPAIGNTQAQMLADFLWIQDVFNLPLSKCAKLARNIIVNNHLKCSYEPLKYVDNLEIPAYNKYQKLQFRYFALNVINILPFVKKENLENLIDPSSTIEPARINSGKQIANILTSIYVVLEKYLITSYVGNGKWLPKISNPHGGTVGVSISALYYLSKLKHNIDVLEKKFGIKDEVLENMKEYGIKELKDTQRVEETIGYIMSSQATDGSWGGITKSLPTTKTVNVGKKEIVRCYYEPGLGKVFVTSQAVIGLLRMGVSATNSSIEKAVNFLINSQSEDGYWKSNFYPWSDVMIAAINALNEYAKYRWNKEVDISKFLLQRCSKGNVDMKMLSQRVGTLYVDILNRLVYEGVMMEAKRF